MALANDKLNTRVVAKDLQAVYNKLQTQIAGITANGSGKIDIVRVNGTEQPVTNKAVDITVPEYTLTAATNPDSGYSATYLFKKDNTVVSRLNLALDYFCKAVSAVLVAKTGDDAVTNGNIPVGHKYVDFTVGAQSGGTDQHLYVDLADLVDVYTAGDGVSISDDKVITLTPATTTTLGAMSAADKTKLDGVADGANVVTFTVNTAAVIAHVNGTDVTLEEFMTDDDITALLGD